MLCADETVEESIVSLLKKRSMGGKVLRSELGKKGLIVSSQSVYNALKKLVRQEVVLKEKTIYGLNYVWLKRLSRFSNTASGDSALFRPQDLTDGDSMVYQFKSLNSAGAFWMHAHQILLDQLKPDQIAALYSTNEWTSIVREPQDKEWAETAAHTDKLTLFAIGRTNIHNRNYKKRYESGNLKISVGNTYGFAPGYYLNVFNDYIVELIVPRVIEEEITKILEETTDSERVKDLFAGIDMHSYKIKLILKRNSADAKRLFRKVARDFYIPKPYSSPFSKINT